jgi:hypothetical protein
MIALSRKKIHGSREAFVDLFNVSFGSAQVLMCQDPLKSLGSPYVPLAEASHGLETGGRRLIETLLFPSFQKIFSEQPSLWFESRQNFRFLAGRTTGVVCRVNLSLGRGRTTQNHARVKSFRSLVCLSVQR